MELLGSPGDLSGLGLANHGRARAFVHVTSVPHQTASAEVLSKCASQRADAHGQASTVTILLTFPSSAPRAPPPRPAPSIQQGCCIVLGHKHTHVIRTPDQRRRPMACLSMVPLCRRKPVRKNQNPGREGGAEEGGSVQRYLSPREVRRQ